MASQSGSKPTKTNDTSLSAPPSKGLANVRLDNDFAEEPHNTSRKAQTRFLNRREAEAGSPADGAVCGEEDPGVALEFLVKDFDEKNNP